MRTAAVVPIKTMMALRRTLDVGDSEKLQADDRDLIFRAGFSSLSVSVQRLDVESPGRFQKRVSMLRTSQRIMVLDLRQVPADVDLMPLLIDIRDKWPDRDKIVFQLRSAADVPMLRATAPANTLVLAGDEAWREVKSVLPDGNIIYSFGPIGPEIFQNQSSEVLSSSSGRDARPMFPPEPERIRQMTWLEPKNLEVMRQYGREKWAVEDVREQLQKWVDWGRRNRRYVWWTGFGCSIGAEEASRRRYFETMARAASYFDLGWCLSAYDGPWSVAKGSASSRSMRSETAAVFSSQ